METLLDQPTLTLPSILARFPRPTPARPAAPRRALGLWSSVAISAGVGVAAALGSSRRGLVASGVAALALGALRWQFARWFAESPAYEVEGTIGKLELRRYPVHLEAQAAVEPHDIESALDRGYGRLACYICGANANREDLPRTTPIVTTMRDGGYTITFAIPPGRAAGSLPAPDDLRVEVSEVPERRIATLAFRGRFTHDNFARHELALLHELIDAGLATRGSVGFACYDSPATLPFLRRNELWIEVV